MKMKRTNKEVVEYFMSVYLMQEIFLNWMI